MNRSFDTSTPIDLAVEIGSGSVQVTATDTKVTQIEVTGPRADDIVVERHDDHIRVTEPHPMHRISGLSRAVQVTVHLPAHSGLSTRLGSADLRTEGALQACTLASGAGAVRVDQAKALDITTGSGTVSIGTVDGDLGAKTGSGDLTVAEVTGTADLISGSADLHLQAVGGAVTARTGSGDVRITTAGGDVTTTTGSGDVEVGGMRRGRLLSRSASGEVAITVAQGTPTWTDLHSVSGAIAHDLQSLGEPTDGQDHVELRVHTVSSTIRLRHGVSA